MMMMVVVGLSGGVGGSVEGMWRGGEEGGGSLILV